MNNEASLPKSQAKDLNILRGMGTEEVSEYAWRMAGAGTAAIAQLAKKGYVTVRTGDFTQPTGPLAGQTLSGQRFYTLAV